MSIRVERKKYVYGLSRRDMTASRPTVDSRFLIVLGRARLLICGIYVKHPQRKSEVSDFTWEL